MIIAPETSYTICSFAGRALKTHASFILFFKQCSGKGTVSSCLAELLLLSDDPQTSAILSDMQDVLLCLNEIFSIHTSGSSFSFLFLSLFFNAVLVLESMKNL